MPKEPIHTSRAPAAIGPYSQAVRAGDLVQLLAVGHLGAVGDLAEDAGGRQAGQAGEVDRRLGMPGAAEHAPLLGHQGEQVPGPHQVARPGLRVDDHADGARPFRDADAGAAAGVTLIAGLGRPCASQKRAR